MGDETISSAVDWYEEAERWFREAAWVRPSGVSLASGTKG